MYIIKVCTLFWRVSYCKVYSNWEQERVHKYMGRIQKNISTPIYTVLLYCVIHTKNKHHNNPWAYCYYYTLCENISVQPKALCFNNCRWCVGVTTHCSSTCLFIHMSRPGINVHLNSKPGHPCMYNVVQSITLTASSTLLYKNLAWQRCLQWQKNKGGSDRGNYSCTFPIHDLTIL